MFALSPASPRPAPEGGSQADGGPSGPLPPKHSSPGEGETSPRGETLYTCADYFPIIYSSDPYVHAEIRLHSRAGSPGQGPGRSPGWGAGRRPLRFLHCHLCVGTEAGTARKAWGPERKQNHHPKSKNSLCRGKLVSTVQEAE